MPVDTRGTPDNRSDLILVIQSMRLSCSLSLQIAGALFKVYIVRYQEITVLVAMQT